MPPIRPLILAFATALALASCATPAETPPTGSAATPPAGTAPTPMPRTDTIKNPESAPGEPPMECDNTSTGWAIGQDADTNLIERVRVETHSERVRVLKPGQMVTMEFRADRVNIDVDADNRVLRVRCG